MNLFSIPDLKLSLFFLKVLIKEEDRLATVITAIDQEVAIVPRGAYIRVPTGEVRKNRMFEGKSISYVKSLI